MCAVARDLYFSSRVLAALAAVHFVTLYDAPARRMRTFFLIFAFLNRHTLTVPIIAKSSRCTHLIQVSGCPTPQARSTSTSNASARP